MKWILNLIKSKTTLVILAVYTLVSFWFYWDTFWSQIAYDRSQTGWEVTGEIRSSEWGIEQILGKLDRRENPFSRIDGIMYPYGVDIVASDPGLAFLVAPWRRFFSIHQALILVIVGGMIGAGLGMYLLLRELGTSKMASFVVGLAYENNTFILPRMGHVGYLASFWIFPWFFWLWTKFFNATSKLRKTAYLVCLITLYVSCLWINFYYFVILNLGIGMLLLYYLIWQSRITWNVIKSNFVYIPIAIGTLVLLSWGWVETLISTLKFSEVAKPQGWGGAIEFSSDLLNIFVPSAYNYYYGEIISKLGKHIGFIRTIFEDYNYPGVLILLVMVFGLWQIAKKRKWGQQVQPFWWTAVGFWILTLGPFLQIAGRMYLSTEEDIRIVLPLPFALLHYLPYFNNLRVPGRLAMGMVFFGLITAGFIIDHLYTLLSKKWRRWFWVVVILIIVIDQRPTKMELETIAPNYPGHLYDLIKQDKEKSSVMMVPFTVRDGLTWFGEYNAVNIDFAQTYFQKPLIGGYVGRVPDYVKEYYRSNAFVGKIGRMIDPDLSTNPFMLNVSERDKWGDDLGLAKEAVELLNIKYVLIVDSPQYSCTKYAQVENFLKSLGYYAVANEGGYTLYQHPPMAKDYTEIKIGNPDDNIQLGMGWWSRESGYRWAQKKSSALVKNTQEGKYKLTVEGASFKDPQIVTMYIDEKKIGAVSMGTELATINSETEKLSPGLHIVHLLYEHEYAPKDVIPGSLDQRKLAAKISRITLTRVE